jgi:hypothetical protein
VAGAAVTETEYFDLLEGRVSSELARMRQRELRSWWCDGFLPEKFVVTRSGSHVAGRVWMDPGDGDQALWSFVLLLGPRPVDRDEVQWAELLPAADATGWLSLDFERQFMKIKPSAAYPDAQAVP